MASKNMPVEDWTDAQREKGIVQLHVQRLRIKNGRVRNSASVTVHSTERDGLFDAACKSILDLTVGSEKPATSEPGG